MTLEGLNYPQRHDYGARDRQKFSVVFTIKCRPGMSHHGLENELRALVAQAQKRPVLPAAIRTFAPRFVVKLFEN